MKKKLIKIWHWVDDRGGLSELFKPLTTHLVPPGAKWNYVWGSATLFCLIVQVLTGIALAFLYQPSAPDLTNVDADPKPDWYFTWIFALFALMPRQIESYVIFFGPLIGIIVLFSVPFLSNKGERSPLRRPWAMGGILFIIVSICGLWYIGIKAPWSPHFNAKPLSEYSTVPKPSEEVKKGISLFNTMGCIYCHKIGDQGGIRGPELTDVQNRLTHDQMIIRIANGAENMPAYGGSLKKEEMEAIVSFLLQNKKQNSIE